MGKKKEFLEKKKKYIYIYIIRISKRKSHTTRNLVSTLYWTFRAFALLRQTIYIYVYMGIISDWMRLFFKITAETVTLSKIAVSPDGAIQ